jgi:spermidine/putrescine-binding protein
MAAADVTDNNTSPRAIFLINLSLVPGAGDSRSGAQPPAGRVVNFCNWPDYIAPGLIEQVRAETGIEVNYDTYDGNSMLETKLLAGQSGCDVVVPTANFLQRQVAAGVYQPIDRTRLPNYGNLDPDMMSMLAGNDPGNRHAVGYMWGTTGIGYDARKVTALAPDAPPDSWRLVFDPAVARRLAACGIAFVDAPTSRRRKPRGCRSGPTGATSTRCRSSRISPAAASAWSSAGAATCCGRASAPARPGSTPTSATPSPRKAR